MWSEVNKIAKELYTDCSSKAEETRKKVQEATKEIKGNSDVLSSLALDGEDSKIKKKEFAADVVCKYKKIVSAANETIGHCVSGLEDMEARMRKERVEAILLGRRGFAESTFRSAKSVCIKMNNVYACGFLNEKGEVSFVDKSYPLVSDSVYLTGIQLGIRNGGRALSVDHLNYAVIGEHGAPQKVYRDECVDGNEVTEDLPEGRLSESCMNDTRECSSSFEIDVLAGGVGDTTLLSVTINMCPELYESIKGFKYTGPRDAAAEPTEMEVDITETVSAEDEEDTSDSSSSGNKAPSYYYKPSEDPATRSAERMLSEEFSYARDLHKALLSIQNKGERNKPLSISTSKPSSAEEPLKVNPVLEGLSKAVGDDRERAIASFPNDVQNAIIKVVCGSTAPNKLAATNVLENIIASEFRNDRDVNIANALLEDEDYGTKYALAIVKEIMSSTKILGGIGLDYSSRTQKDIIEGMRSDCGGGNRHSTVECLKQEKLAEAIRDLLCTKFGPKMTVSDAKKLKSKPFYTLRRQNPLSSFPVKKRRASPEKVEGVPEKKRKLEAGEVVASPLDKEGDDDENTTAVFMGTVIPPPLCGEPKEITSSSAMTEMIAEYSSVIARCIAKSPLSIIRMASVVDMIFTLKKTLSAKVSGKSVNTVSIGPVEFDDEVSICSEMYTKLMTKRTKSMEHIINKHKATESIENGMMAVLTMRRLSEERNAYRHLVEVLILENTIGILSGEGVTYSNALYNAATWYMKVVIRNRVCGVRNLLGDTAAQITELCSQVNAALDWMFRFNIDHKLLLERDIISDRAFAPLAPSRDIETPLFKPGGRFYALIGGEDTLPMKMEKMPSSTSILKTIGVFNKERRAEDHMLCINNYETGNLFILSMANINIVERVDKLKDDVHKQLYDLNRWKRESPYLYATPSFQLARDVRKAPLFNEIVGQWDEFAAYPRGEEARIFKKPSKDANDILSSMVMPFLLRGSYKDSWKNLPLFSEKEGGVFQFRYEASPKGRLMTSMVNQALTTTQEKKKGHGKTFTQIVDIIEFYTKKRAMDTRGAHTLSRAYLAVYWKPAGDSTEEEEVCKFDCVHSGSTNFDCADLYTAVDFYEIRGPKNIGPWKRFISTGSTGKATATKAEADGEGTPLLEEEDDERVEDVKRDTKKVDGDNNKYAIQKLPKQHILMSNDVSHENVAPFMAKIYNIVRQGQNIRERYTNKIVNAQLKNNDN